MCVKPNQQFRVLNICILSRKLSIINAIKYIAGIYIKYENYGLDFLSFNTGNSVENCRLFQLS